MPRLQHHQKLPSNWNERESLRKKGQFWTPSWLAEAMVSYVAKGNYPVFDPAAGNGAFFDALLRLKKNNIGFYGIDNDADVLANPIYKHDNCIVENRDFLKNAPDKKFMAIVANPPYIRHHRIACETKSYLQNLAFKITGEQIDGRAGLHIYFFIHALNLLAPNARLAFVMPADTCEGKFSAKLWNWISKNFCIDAVVTFSEEATPFPNVDTNAMVFLIKKSAPADTLRWVRVNQAYQDDLRNFIDSDFSGHKFNSIEIAQRNLSEGIQTGLSRPPQINADSKYRLRDFAVVMRGIATGANDFFFLTTKQVNELKIPFEFFRPAIGRTRDVEGDEITPETMISLERHNRPVNLLYANGHQEFPSSVMSYLKSGEAMGLPDRALIRQRRPWYKMETREIPPLLFAYLGRRNTRFIKNTAGALPLTGFLCVYPFHDDAEYIRSLWQILNHPETLNNLSLVGKSYGSGAIKVEPKNLSQLSIPTKLAEGLISQFSFLPKENLF